jgi:L-aspartate oxidase
MSERFDIIVIGSGASGLSVALGASGARVAVVTRGVLGLDGASCWAQGGIAAAIGPGDSTAQHALDTLNAGARLNQRSAARWLAESAPELIDWLGQIGVHFDRAQGRLALSREPQHTFPRVVHAGGDATGAELMRALREAVARRLNLVLHEFTEALRLRKHGNRVVGVRVRDARGIETDLLAPQVVLATGGLGQLYRYTSNPVECDGAGLALAHAAGAELADLEFVQFHPTALAPRMNQDADQLPLISESLRGAGAWLCTDGGLRLMQAHPQGDLAPREVITREVQMALDRGQRVWLDARLLGSALPTRFPTVFGACMAFGIDPRRDLIPVVPAAHYLMGGVKVDLHSRSSLPGLYAVGEVACTGVHGANRLAGNGLLEAIAFGRELGLRLSRQGGIDAPLPDDSNARSLQMPSANDRLVQQKLRQIMSAHVGAIRTVPGLMEALDHLDVLERRVLPGARSLDRILVCRLIIEAALARPESIGAHSLSSAAPVRSWRSSVA